jgi:tetratricopeptide (TPR) repeat protein
MLGDHRKQLEAARRARLQYPDNSAALGLEMQALAALGRLEELNGRFEERLKLPGPEGAAFFKMWDVGRELRAHGHRVAASKFLQRVLHWLESRASEGNLDRRKHTSLVLAELGRVDEARVMIEEIAAEDPNNDDFLGNLALLAAMQGDREEAARLARLLGERRFPPMALSFLHARIAAHLGEKERAMAFLREAIANGFSPIFALHKTTSLEPLWDYPPDEVIDRWSPSNPLWIPARLDPPLPPRAQPETRRLEPGLF